jgi:hypothetical protein
MLLIYELYASLHFFWASFFIAWYEFQFLVLWVRFARLYSFCFRLDRVRRHCNIKTKASKTQNIHVEKGRHTEIKKQDRGNVKQYTGKVQN